MPDKHTPTPWHFAELKGDDGLGYICGAAGTEIDHLGNSELSQAENQANAALIVRAVNRDHLFDGGLALAELIEQFDDNDILSAAAVHHLRNIAVAWLEKVRAVQ